MRNYANLHHAYVLVPQPELRSAKAYIRSFAATVYCYVHIFNKVS